MTNPGQSTSSAQWLDPTEPVADSNDHDALMPVSPVTTIDEGSGSELPQDSGDEDDLFSDPLWDRPPVRNRLTAALLVASLVVAGFAGGIWVQSKHPQTSASAALPSGLPSGFNPASFGGGGLPAGGLGGAATGVGGAAAGGVGSGPAGARVEGSAAAGSGGGGSAASALAVVGSLQSVSGTTLKVKNFAGSVVSVVVTDTTRVTTNGLQPLAAGATVSVFGEKKADGTVTATQVTVSANG